MLSLHHAMKLLYDREINCVVSCFWDSGWQVRVGDEMNGFDAVGFFDNADLDKAGQWLLDTAAGVCPKVLRKIITTYVYPPIPSRNCDWQAHFDGDEPDDDGRMKVGHGPTEYEAIKDLLDGE